MTALHVFPKFSGSPYGTYGPAEDVLEEAHRNLAQAEGDRLFTRLRNGGPLWACSSTRCWLKNNNDLEQVISIAKKKKCDLIWDSGFARPPRDCGGAAAARPTRRSTHSNIPVLVVR